MARTYMIIDSSEISLLDFSKLVDVSEEYLKKSMDKSKALIRWDGSEPYFVSILLTKSERLTSEQAKLATMTEEWIGTGNEEDYVCEAC
jgi:hypothetical protein